MKNTLSAKRIISAIIACAISLACCAMASSCGKKTDSYALYGTNQDGDIRAYMTEGMFSYFLSQQKSTYLAVLSYNDSSITADSPEIWNRLSPKGLTYEQEFFAEVLSEAQTLLTANTLLYSMPSANGKGKYYSLPENYIDYVNALVSKNAIEKYGSVMAFEDYLLNFGTTLEEYTQLYIMTANIDLLKDALFADETGLYPITEQQKKQYYADNYYSVRHIFVNTAYDEKIDGTRAPLTSAESQKRSDVSENIYNFIKSGQDFDSAAESFSQSYVTVYPGVSSMDINSDTSNAPELGNALKEMEISEVRRVQSKYGYHIIQRVQTDPESYNENETILNAIRSAIINKQYPEILENNKSLVTINSEITDKFTLAEAFMP